MTDDRSTAVQVIYEYLLDQKLLRYEYEDAMKPEGQLIRPPELIHRDKEATCIDLTLMLAAGFARAKLFPVVVQFPVGTNYHAMVGVWLEPAARPTTLEPDGCDGFCTDLDWTSIPLWVHQKKFLILEATGVTYGTPWKEDRLPFADACRRAEERLKSACPVDRSRHPRSAGGRGL